MRVGISFLPTSRVAVHLGEALRRIGYVVDLVAVSKDEWFTDCSSEQNEWNVVPILSVKDKYDIFIDTIGNINSALRRQLGVKVVMFIDEDITMSLRENIIYEKDRRVFGWEGADEVWTWWSVNVEVLRVLSKLFVRLVPFYWSPFHLTDLGEYTGSEGELMLHLIGSNKSVKTSTIQSMILCSNLKQKRVFHNTDRLVECAYFKNNIKPGLKEGSYENTINLEATLKQNTCIVSNLRFVDGDSLVAARELLDYVWLGMPVVHNSTWLRDFGHGYEDLYYNDPSELEGAIRKVEEGWTCLSTWRVALEEAVSSVEEWEEPAQTTSDIGTKKMVIQFSDFWENFNPEYNFFTLLFTEALGVKCRVVGVGERYDGRADLVVCGPYSERWRQLDSTIPKICFTGELSQPVYGNGIFLNIGFFANGYGFSNTGVNYCRFPLWAASINWFGADNNRLVNPTLIDIDDCLRSHEGTAARKKFCAFVVSNPNCRARNEAFKTLNAYKPVDSAGSLFNNMGNGLFAGAGGGGGERRKVEFFRDYRFAIVYENNSWSGYTTEKLFHAKVAGCLPLYWGDPMVAQDFDARGYVNLTNREGDLLEIVKQLEARPDELDLIAASPALSEEKIDNLRETMAVIVKYTMDHVFPSEKTRWLEELPLMLGGRSSAEAASAATLRLELGLEKPGLAVEEIRTMEFGEKIRKMLFVLYADVADMGDLYLWLSHTNTMALETKAEYVLYYKGRADRRLEYILKMYPWIRIVATEATKEDVLATLSQTEEEGRLICYMSPRVVLVNNPYYMCCVAEQKGICRLRLRDRLVDNSVEPAPMEDFMIYKANSWSSSSQIQMIIADNFVGFDNMDKSKHSGKAAYCWSTEHGFKYKDSFLEGITDCSIINLKRRPDRLMRFAKHHGQDVADRIKIVDAVDGRKLKLTPAIQRLFEESSFGWKKGVIGCNLSHLKLWYGLAHSNQYCENLLVLEDDVRFEEGWESRLVEAMQKAPVDYDVLYLGGVLPPNKGLWPTVREPVNPFWDRIGENTVFTTEPQRYFHFCAYSYILSKRGAEKLLEGIQRDGGYKRVSDHQILNPANKMNIYVINPLIAGCYQEDDPVYMTTNFNQTQKDHTYDSDLWTNSDCFVPSPSNSAPLDISNVLEDAVLCEESYVETTTAAISPPILFLSQNASKTYEKSYLRDIFSMPDGTWEKAIIVDNSNITRTFTTIKENQIIIVYREVSEEEMERLVQCISLAHQYKKKIIMIHLSDEYCRADISFYEDPAIMFIVRNYIRGDIPATVRKKIITVPLGWWRQTDAEKTTLESRPLLWSFHGTVRSRRKKMIEALVTVNPHSLRVKESWDAVGSTAEEYMADIMKSVFIPCPEGINPESFRIYEALEAGCIPILVDEGRSKGFYPWIQTALPSIIVARSWDSALRVFADWSEDPSTLAARRCVLLAEWGRWKGHLRNVIQKYVFWA